MLKYLPVPLGAWGGVPLLWGILVCVTAHLHLQISKSDSNQIGVNKSKSIQIFGVSPSVLSCYFENGMYTHSPKYLWTNLRVLHTEPVAYI